MKVSIDKEKCIGCGACVALCPDGFEMRGDKAVVKAKAGKPCSKQAAENCPTKAILIK